MLNLILYYNKLVYNSSAAKGNKIVMNCLQMEEELTPLVRSQSDTLRHAIRSRVHFSSYLALLHQTPLPVRSILDIMSLSSALNA
jgi:hypothetical protein